MIMEVYFNDGKKIEYELTFTTFTKDSPSQMNKLTKKANTILKEGFTRRIPFGSGHKTEFYPPHAIAKITIIEAE